nr:hypothetical protein [uncultured Prevotella sp.]
MPHSKIYQALKDEIILAIPCIYMPSITITDINSEISDADNATNSIKFKYKYSSHRLPITIDYGNNIFDDPFRSTFD